MCPESQRMDPGQTELAQVSEPQEKAPGLKPRLDIAEHLER